MAPEKPLNNDLDVEKARKQKKAEELDNSTFFDVHRWSDYPETNKAVDALLEEFNAGPKLDSPTSNVSLSRRGNSMAHPEKRQEIGLRWSFPF